MAGRHENDSVDQDPLDRRVGSPGDEVADTEPEKPPAYGYLAQRIQAMLATYRPGS